MSDEPAAILATFSHFMRPVASRKVVPIVFEVPLEEFHKVIAALGTPDPANPVWCGIARVARKGKAGDGHVREVLASPSEQTPADSGAGAVQYKSPATNSITLVEGETGGAPRALSAAPPVSKSKRRWSEMPPSQRAALLTGDTEFWRYLGTCGVAEPSTATAADASLKFLCGIQSKRELDEREKAASAFERLHGNFKAWQSARGHGVI